MLIKSISLNNFRCLKNQSIDFEHLTAILGRNGAGKTSILSALEIFYDTKAQINVEDFYNNDTSSPIEIRVVFGEFREGEELDTFKPYIQNGEMPVTKVIELSEGTSSQKYFGEIKQIPQFAEIRMISGKQYQVAAYNELVDRNELQDLQRVPSRGADLEGAMNAYETAHPELMKWFRREEQFFGARNIGGGRLDKYTKFVRIPALRDVMDDVAEKKGSPIIQLLEMVVMRRIEARDDIRQFREEFGQRLREVYRPENLGEIKELEENLNSTLRMLAPNSSLGLLWGEPKIPDIPYPAIIPQLQEDGFSGAINRKGHGVQRALIFSLLQNLALATNQNNGNDTHPHDENDHEEDAEQIREAIGADIILAIDEPELYQHPLRSKHLSSIFHHMTESRSELNGRNQIILTTHSPYFVDLRHFSEIRIVRKVQPEDGAQTPCSTISKYSLAEAAREMARINNIEQLEEIRRFTESSFYARCYPVMTPSVSEGFFADAVVLVEGLTEIAFLSKIAEILSKSLLEKGIAIISVDGKTKLDRAGIIFKGLSIPVYIIFDGDISNKGTKEEQKEIEANHRLLRLVGATPIDFPKDYAGSNYACFENNMEEYCRKVLGDQLYSVTTSAIADEYCYEKPSNILKNYETACAFVNRIYQRGNSFPLIEEMINNISSLIPGVE